jgi:hypothetical protein
MYAITAVISCLSLCVLEPAPTDMERRIVPPENTDRNAVTITLTATDVNDKTLRLGYRVENQTTHDIWLCNSMSVGGSDFEVCWDRERQAFVIRKRSHVPWSFATNVPLTRYVRLRPRGHLTEFICLPVPIQPQAVVGSEDTPVNTMAVTRIVLELGYYEGDLPGIVHRTLQARSEVEFLYFVELNERWKITNDELLFYMKPTIGGEHLLQVTTDVRPVAFERPSRRSRTFALSLTTCSRIEMSCQPSALDFFFPYADQQVVLTRAERQQLGALHSVVAETSQDTKACGDALGKAIQQGIAFGEGSARVVCYADNDRMATFQLHRNSFITDSGQPFFYPESSGGRLADVIAIGTQLRPFALRMRCADNLRHLYSRLRLYNALETFSLSRTVATHAGQYPVPVEWCDAILDAYRPAAVEEMIKAPFVCPAAGEGKCHYAMNSACTYDSPGDTVLLLETKAGWNQHGGPELFTFDNHDPRGGCVLLNDGTVKFIRTEEELKQLRWK